MKDAEQNPTEDQNQKTGDEPAGQDAAGSAAPENTAADGGNTEKTDPTEPVTLTGEQYQTLLEKAAKSEHNWELFLRERAELENLRKRMAREKQDTIKYANEGLISDLLPVLDNFEAALIAAENSTDLNIDALKTGVNMIHGQFKNLLTDLGLQEIDATGKDFDPSIHDALGEEDSTEVGEGKVLRQLRKGYRLRERLLRAASVFVARKPESGGKTADGETSQEPAGSEE